MRCGHREGPARLPANQHRAAALPTPAAGSAALAQARAAPRACSRAPPARARCPSPDPVRRPTWPYAPPYLTLCAALTLTLCSAAPRAGPARTPRPCGRRPCPRAPAAAMAAAARRRRRRRPPRLAQRRPARLPPAARAPPVSLAASCWAAPPLTPRPLPPPLSSPRRVFHRRDARVCASATAGMVMVRLRADHRPRAGPATLPTQPTAAGIQARWPRRLQRA